MRTLVRRKAVRMEAQKSRGFYLCKEQKGKAMGNLDIKEQKKKWIYLKEWNCYKLEQVCYCEKPRVQKEQSMNIFVPAEYLDGQGNVLHEEIRMAIPPARHRLFLKTDWQDTMKQSPLNWMTTVLWEWRLFWLVLFMCPAAAGEEAL